MKRKQRLERLLRSSHCQHVIYAQHIENYDFLSRLKCGATDSLTHSFDTIYFPIHQSGIVQIKLEQE